ncbi:MAG: nuclear transport factor 2 family protein [Pseudomonadota bacterium]
MANVKQVQEMYAAFGRGDVPAILAVLAEDVEWEYGVNSTGVPWLQPRRGRAEVKKFFEALAAVEISKFQPRTFLETGNIVITLIDLEATVKASGRKVIEEDEVHIWRFDDQGRVIRFRHRVDTHQHLMALRP